VAGGWLSACLACTRPWIPSPAPEGKIANQFIPLEIREHTSIKLGAAGVEGETAGGLILCASVLGQAVSPHMLCGLGPSQDFLYLLKQAFLPCTANSGRSAGPF
jgi:hypothetical protein